LPTAASERMQAKPPSPPPQHYPIRLVAVRVARRVIVRRQHVGDDASLLTPHAVLLARADETACPARCSSATPAFPS
jgi:hypothetical protein